MAHLDARQERLIAGLARSQRWTSLAGLAITLLAIGYGAWAVLRFDPRADPRLAPGFDRPVARLAFLYEPHQSVIETVKANTPVERRLQRTLVGGMRTSAGVIGLLVRLLLATLAGMTGLAMMTVTVERRRLLRMIHRLREPTMVTVEP